jgi:hypothetical protein
MYFVVTPIDATSSHRARNALRKPSVAYGTADALCGTVRGVSEPESRRVEHQLRRLARLYYALGVFEGLYAVACLTTAVIGLLLYGGAIEEQPWLPPRSLIVPFIGSWFGWTAFGSVLTALSVLTARRVSKRRSRLFCLFASMANLSFLPWGTLLGVYSIVALNRPGIRVAFGE